MFSIGVSCFHGDETSSWYPINQGKSGLPASSFHKKRRQAEGKGKPKVSLIAGYKIVRRLKCCSQDFVMIHQCQVFREMTHFHCSLFCKIGILLSTIPLILLNIKKFNKNVKMGAGAIAEWIRCLSCIWPTQAWFPASYMVSLSLPGVISEQGQE